jgi:hypothetical protein
MRTISVCVHVRIYPPRLVTNLYLVRIRSAYIRLQVTFTVTTCISKDDIKTKNNSNTPHPDNPTIHQPHP